MTALLPSRASHPSHCRECDGPCDLPGLDCSECVGRPWWERLEWRYVNDEGITQLWQRATTRGGGWWVAQREFHPMVWAVAIEVRFGSEPVFALTVGPLTLFVGRPA